MPDVMLICEKCGTEYSSGLYLDNVNYAQVANCGRRCRNCGHYNEINGNYRAVGGVLEKLVSVNVPDRAVQQFVLLVRQQQQNVISLSQLERKAGGLHPDLGKAVKKLKKHWKKVGLVTVLLGKLASCYPNIDLSGNLHVDIAGSASIRPQDAPHENGSSEVNVQEPQRNKNGGEARTASGGAKKEGQNVAHTRSPRPKPRGRVR